MTKAATLGMTFVMLVGCSRGGGATADAALAGSCPSSWLAPPSLDPRLTVPDHGAVLMHAAATGSQIYACAANGDGGAAWTLQGPDAVLSDCSGAVVGHHFASDAGSGSPEWQTADGTFVVGRKLAAVTPDGGAGSVPWLLLQASSKSGQGSLGRVTYIQRVGTDGGLAAGACDAGQVTRVPYSADYYFYGP